MYRQSCREGQIGGPSGRRRRQKVYWFLALFVCLCVYAHSATLVTLGDSFLAFSCDSDIIKNVALIGA